MAGMPLARHPRLAAALCFPAPEIEPGPASIAFPVSGRIIPGKIRSIPARPAGRSGPPIPRSRKNDCQDPRFCRICHPHPIIIMDYIPKSDSGFASWLSNFSALLTASPTTYGLSAPDAVVVAAENTAFQSALTAASDPTTRTSVTVAAKDAARATAESIVRPFAVSISLNATVSNGDKTAIGVTVRSTTPTPIPAPVAVPSIELIKATPLVQQLQIRQTGSTSKAKPAGAVSIEVARSIGTVPATDPDQLQIVGQYGKTPLLQNFVAGNQGKVVTYAARYRTQSGPGGVSQAGPWSALVHFTVL